MIAVVRDSIPAVRGELINVGGDIHVWGTAPTGATWQVAVANPRDHADNAVPLTRLALRNRAVSSSGDYENVVSRLAGATTRTSSIHEPATPSTT